MEGTKGRGEKGSWIEEDRKRGGGVSVAECVAGNVWDTAETCLSS